MGQTSLTFCWEQHSIKSHGQAHVEVPRGWGVNCVLTCCMLFACLLHLKHGFLACENILIVLFPLDHTCLKCFNVFHGWFPFSRRKDTVPKWAKRIWRYWREIRSLWDVGKEWANQRNDSKIFQLKGTKHFSYFFHYVFFIFRWSRSTSQSQADKATPEPACGCAACASGRRDTVASNLLPRRTSGSSARFVQVWCWKEFVANVQCLLNYESSIV